MYVMYYTHVTQSIGRAQSDWSLQALTADSGLRIRERLEYMNLHIMIPNLLIKAWSRKMRILHFNPSFPRPSLSCTLQALLGFHSPNLTSGSLPFRKDLRWVFTNFRHTWALKTDHSAVRKGVVIQNLVMFKGHLPQFRKQIYVKQDVLSHNGSHKGD